MSSWRVSVSALRLEGDVAGVAAADRTVGSVHTSMKTVLGLPQARPTSGREASRTEGQSLGVWTTKPR